MDYPRTFAEFYAQHPKYIRQIIAKNRWVSRDEISELEQELLSELLRKRVVEKFDPDVYGGNANVRLFLAYVATCVRRLHLTGVTKRKIAKHSINTIAISLSEPLQDTKKSGLVGDLVHDGGRSQRATDAAISIAEFARFVARRQPELIPIMDAIQATGSTLRKDIAEHLGLKVTTVRGRMKYMNQLAKEFAERFASKSRR